MSNPENTCPHLTPARNLSPCTTPPPAMDGEHGRGPCGTFSSRDRRRCEPDASSSIPPQGGIGAMAAMCCTSASTALQRCSVAIPAPTRYLPSTLLSINADADTGMGGADIGSTLISKLFAAGPSALAHVQVGDAPSAPQGGGEALT